MRSLSLVAGVSAAIVLIGLLALSAVAERGAKLSYFGAIDPDPAASDGSVEGSAGDECVWEDSKFETFSGALVSVRVTQQPRWEIRINEIRAVTIYEAMPSPGLSGSHTYVFAQLEVDQATKKRIGSVRSLCGTYVRVQRDGHDLDLAPIVGLEPGVLPGGSFGSREEAEHFYRAIEERISYVALSDENRAYWQTRNDELTEIALWYAKCDADYLKSLGDGLYEHIRATPSLRQRSDQANCDDEPPQIPLSPAASQ